MMSREACLAPPLANRPWWLRQWWLDRPLWVKGLIMATVPLFARPILLDLQLQDLHGSQVLKELRAEPVTAAIPVVVLSADATPGVIRRLLAGGALAYLTKPLDLAEFGELLDSFSTPSQDHQARTAMRRSPA
jgi:CheY-like chemotaxis protein